MMMMRQLLSSFSRSLLFLLVHNAQRSRVVFDRVRSARVTVGSGVSQLTSLGLLTSHNSPVITRPDQSFLPTAYLKCLEWWFTLHPLQVRLGTPQDVQARLGIFSLRENLFSIACWLCRAESY